MTKAYSTLQDNDGLCEGCNRPESKHERQVTVPVRLGGGLGMGTMWMCPQCVEKRKEREAAMKVLGFRVFYHQRIVMQLLGGFGGQDFAAYVGVILDENVSHKMYEPIEAGGQGQTIPNAVKVSYTDAKANFGFLIEKLEAEGKYWRR